MPAKFRLAIIGSGPAGLSAAARAEKLGINYILIEKANHLLDTVSKYHRGKLVMATPARLELRSDLPFAPGTCWRARDWCRTTRSCCGFTVRKD